jgi:hypothetical protein
MIMCMVKIMKIHHCALIIFGLVTTDLAAAQLYLPVPPTTGEGTWQLILTNVAQRPTSFRRTIYAPGQTPNPQPVTGLYSLQTDTAAVQGEPAVRLEVVETFKPGITVSSRFVDSQGHGCRLPVFKPSDVVARGEPMAFQFWPVLAPYEGAVIVVFSPARVSATCSVNLNNNIGRVSGFSLTVPAASQIASVQFSAPATQVDFLRVTCDRPVLTFAYRGTAPDLEFIAPANFD